MTGGYRLRPGDQPLPAPAAGPSMHDLVCQDLRTRWPAGRGPEKPDVDAVIAGLQARKRLGLERYGSVLQAGNGRDAARDLAEELMDAVVYCRQLIEEDFLSPRPEGYARPVEALYDGLIGMLFRVRWIREARAGIPPAGPEARAEAPAAVGEQTPAEKIAAIQALFQYCPDRGIPAPVVLGILRDEPLPPHALYGLADRDPARYRAFMRAHGHILEPGDPGYEDAPRNLECGWPGRPS